MVVCFGVLGLNLGVFFYFLRLMGGGFVSEVCFLGEVGVIGGVVGGFLGFEGRV